MTVEVDVAAIQQWASQDTEQGSELSSWQRYPGMGFDPDSGDLVDWSGEWRTRDLIEMLDTDGMARAAEQALTLPLRGAPLTVKPTPGDKGEAEFVNGVFDQLADPVDDLIGQAAQSLIFRMTFLEKLWTVRDGKTVYGGLAWRPTDSCAATRNPGTGALTGFKQQMTWWGGRASATRKPGSWVNIGMDKAVVFVHGRARDPIHGVSELTAASQAYQFKQKIKFLWAVFLKGASVQRVIATTQDGQEQAVAGTLAKLAAGGVVALSENVLKGQLQALDATDSGAFFKEALGYYDNEMLASILAGFLGLAGAATSGRGSFALSKDQSDFFLQAQDSAAREVSSTIRSQIVRPLLVVNFGPSAVMPHVQLGPISRATAQEQMDFLKGLAAGQGAGGAADGGSAKGLVPQEFIDELVVKIAGYLDLDTDKVVAAIKAAPAPDVAPTAASSAAPNLDAAVSKAAEMVQKAQAGTDPLAA